jgi:glycosyltransferase involved in cell wall biosynthesis
MFSGVMSEKPDIHFTIVIPTLNCSQWVENCLSSVCNQSHSNYDVIYIDDASTDGTAEAVEAFLKLYPFNQGLFKLVKNPFNKGKMENIYHAITEAKDGTVIVIVDGDDWLAHSNVLAKLASIYSSSDVWMTNGSYKVEPTGEVVTPRVENSYWEGTIRHKSWEFSHLGTFKKELFCRIKRKDLMNKRGEFWATTSDQAIMWPMAEMCGPDHFRGISEVLYIYNRLNPLADDRVHREDQLMTEQTIRAAVPYARLKAL